MNTTMIGVKKMPSKKSEPPKDERYVAIATSNQLLGLDHFIERKYPGIGKPVCYPNGTVTLDGLSTERFFIGLQRPKNTPEIWTLYEKKGAGT